MGMDVDAVWARRELEKLSDLISEQPHGERKDICDDIIDFVEQMYEKYNNTKKSPA